MVSFTDESTEARPNQPLPLSYVRVDFRLSDVARSGSPYASLALGNVRSNATAVGPFLRVSVCPLNVSAQSSDDPSPPVSNANSPRALKIAAGVVASRAYTSTLNGSTRKSSPAPPSRRTPPPRSPRSFARHARARPRVVLEFRLPRQHLPRREPRARASLVHPHAHRARFHPLHATPPATGLFPRRRRTTSNSTARRVALGAASSRLRSSRLARLARLAFARKTSSSRTS